MPDKQAKLLKLPPNGRVWGPAKPFDVSYLVCEVLGDETNAGLDEILRLYAVGEIDEQEVGYRIALLFEATEGRMRQDDKDSGREYVKDEECWEHA